MQAGWQARACACYTDHQQTTLCHDDEGHTVQWALAHVVSLLVVYGAQRRCIVDEDIHTTLVLAHDVLSQLVDLFLLGQVSNPDISILRALFFDALCHLRGKTAASEVPQSLSPGFEKVGSRL